MKTKWLLSPHEMKLCRMTGVLFWTIGSLAGSISVILWSLYPLLILPVSTLLFFLGVYVWERIARALVRL